MNLVVTDFANTLLIDESSDYDDDESDHLLIDSRVIWWQAA